MSANSDCEPNASRPKRKLEYAIAHSIANGLKTQILINGYDGIAAIKKHAEGANHKRLIKADKLSNTITTFFPKVDSNLQLKVTAVEVSKIFHNVMHGLSYASADCGKYCFL